MRILIIYLSILLLSASAQAYVVEGRVSSLGEQLRPTVYLARIPDIHSFESSSLQFIIDSTVIDDAGNFRIQGRHLLQKNSVFDKEEKDTLSWGGQNEVICRLYMVPKGYPASSITGDKAYSIYLVLKEDSHIELQFDSDDFGAYNLVQSNVGSNELRKLRQHIVKPLYDQIDSVKIIYAEAEQSENITKDSLNALQERMFRKLAATYEKIQPELRQSIMAFENINAQLFAAMVHVDYNSVIHDDLTFFRKLENHLESTCTDCQYVKQFRGYLQDAYILKPGTPAPGFHDDEYDLVDTQGVKHDLAAWKGKVVLLDFWASWCSPCREAIREKLPSLYQKYGKDHFEIIGISREKDKNAWKKALKQDQVAWTSLYQPPSSEPSITDAYSVRALPHYVLIDKKGQIVSPGGILIQIEAQLERMLKVENSSDTMHIRFTADMPKSNYKSRVDQLTKLGLELNFDPRFKNGYLKGLSGSLKDASGNLNSFTNNWRMKQVTIVVKKEQTGFVIGSVRTAGKPLFEN